MKHELTVNEESIAAMDSIGMGPEFLDFMKKMDKRTRMSIRQFTKFVPLFRHYTHDMVEELPALRELRDEWDSLTDKTKGIQIYDDVSGEVLFTTVPEITMVSGIPYELSQIVDIYINKTITYDNVRAAKEGTNDMILGLQAANHELLDNQVELKNNSTLGAAKFFLDVEKTTGSRTKGLSNLEDKLGATIPTATDNESEITAEEMQLLFDEE